MIAVMLSASVLMPARCLGARRHQSTCSTSNTNSKGKQAAAEAHRKRMEGIKDARS